MSATIELVVRFAAATTTTSITINNATDFPTMATQVQNIIIVGGKFAWYNVCRSHLTSSLFCRTHSRQHPRAQPAPNAPDSASRCCLLCLFSNRCSSRCRRSRMGEQDHCSSDYGISVWRQLSPQSHCAQQGCRAQERLDRSGEGI